MKWVDGRYNSSSADLGIIQLNVMWAMVERGAPGGYEYRYGNVKSKRLYPSMEAAQLAAEKSVRNRLITALAVLGEA